MKRIQQHLVDKGYDLGTWGPKGDGVDGAPGKDTYSAMTEYIKELCKNNKYIFFLNNPYWFRMSGVFDDQFSDFCAIVINGECVSISNATTKPGKYWVSNPVTVGGITGTGCRVACQSISSHKWVAYGKSKWGGKKAGYFKQIAAVLIHRDGNKDTKLDKNIVRKAPPWYGFFMHAMGSGRRIWNWSAGCLGAPLVQWLKNVVPYFNDGDIINDTIFEV